MKQQETQSMTNRDEAVQQFADALSELVSTGIESLDPGASDVVRQAVAQGRARITVHAETGPLTISCRLRVDDEDVPLFDIGMEQATMN
ncbi:tRNA-dihydrouridine synthase [Thiohalobacter thiocyanaticus]|uniref:tRNA-dihydrouridine synthase n=1 Tax=Thiohalobacter thiocyanaticus TaxID=585455 RepID=A0A1Z4VRN7_9GAMM|nr:hypothetical protein [Thiohalobacter thiocyanaticus]BAZ94297.1 tRNA-dihydrouridine synthase [Thiohalobacter thiocyanaticus]